MAGSTEYKVNIVIQSTDKSSKSTDSASKGLDKLKKAANFAVGAFAALKAAQGAVDFIKTGAAINRQAKSLDSLAKSAGTSGKEIVSAIQGASDHTIDRMTAMSAANKAMMLDVAKSPEAFSRLAKVATALGRAMGQDAATSIEDFTVAAGRQSMQIADNLGLTVQAGLANEKYAKQMGKSVDAMTTAEKKQAFLNEMLEQGEAKMAELGDGSLDTAGKIEQLEAAASDAKTSIAEMVAASLDGSGALDWITDSVAIFPETIQRVNMLGTALRDSINAAKALQSPSDAWNESLRKQVALLDESNPEIERYAAATKKVGVDTSNATNEIRYMDTATLDLVKSDGDLLNSIMAATESINAEKEALGLAETATWAQAMAAQDLKLKQEELAIATQAATMAQLELSAQLLDASNAQIAKAAIDQLKIALDAGKITFDEYQSAVGETQLKFGLASEKSVILAAGVAGLAAKLASGQIKASNYAESLGKIIESSGRAARAAESMATALNNIPRNIDVSINVRESIGRRESQAGPGPGPRMQHGGAFTVPPGYPNDTFPMRVSSGERVIVIPRSQTTNNNFTLNSSTMASQPRINESFQMMQELAG